MGASRPASKPRLATLPSKELELFEELELFDVNALCETPENTVVELNPASATPRAVEIELDEELVEVNPVCATPKALVETLRISVLELEVVRPDVKPVCATPRSCVELEDDDDRFASPPSAVAPLVTDPPHATIGTTLVVTSAPRKMLRGTKEVFLTTAPTAAGRRRGRLGRLDIGGPPRAKLRGTTGLSRARFAGRASPNAAAGGGGVRVAIAL
jgi:hypothetical protein